MLNIIGLSIGLAASWIVFRISSYEFSFNSQFPDKEKIFKAVSLFDFDGNSGNNLGVPKPMYLSFQNEISGVEKAIPTFTQYYEKATIPSTKSSFNESENGKIVKTTNAYFEVFKYKWLVGNSQTALTEPFRVVLTDKVAQKYFKTTDYQSIIGENIAFNDSLNYQVSGVVEALNFPTDLNYETFVSFKNHNYEDVEWSNTNSSDQLYIKVKSNANLDAIVKEMNYISKVRSEKFMKNWGEKMKRWHDIKPLENIHFLSDFGGGEYRKANLTTLQSIMGVAAFLLLLAAINYINMAIANIPNRAKEIGIRKTLGGSSKTIIFRFMFETLIVLLISSVFAYFLSLIFFNYYDFAAPEGMLEFIDFKLFFIAIVVFVLFVTFISGFYPGYLMSKFEAVNIMKQKFKIQSKSLVLSFGKGLIIFQFLVASIFILGTLIVSRQLNFLLHKELGFNNYGVITIPIPWKSLTDSTQSHKKFALQNELQKIKSIQSVSLGEALLRDGMSSNNFSRTDEKGKKFEAMIQRKISDYGIQSVYDLKLVAGRFLKNGDSERSFVINESACKALGFKNPKDAIGVSITEGYVNKDAQIVGVVKDFHSLSLVAEISPLAIMNYKEELAGFNIRFASNNTDEWQQTIEEIKSLWSKFYHAEDFKYSFYDDTVKRMLETETRMSKLINLASIITILISCLGLFGLSTFQAHQKAKEIGIRKVLGATVASIVYSLSKGFLLLIIIAFAIAIPIVYYFSDKWLQNYPYKPDYPLWIYALAFCLMLFVSIATVVYQSLKAAYTNPVDSLRGE